MSDEIIKNIGKKLKQRRIDLRLTQVQLSDLIGIEYSALRRIETGRTNPTIKTLLKLTNALSIDVSYLFEKWSVVYSILELMFSKITSCEEEINFIDLKFWKILYSKVV